MLNQHCWCCHAVRRRPKKYLIKFILLLIFWWIISSYLFLDIIDWPPSWFWWPSTDELFPRPAFHLFWLTHLLWVNDIQKYNVCFGLICLTAKYSQLLQLLRIWFFIVLHHLSEGVGFFQGICFFAMISLLGHPPQNKYQHPLNRNPEKG